MNFFTKVSSLVLVSSVIFTSLVTVSTFAVTGDSTSQNTNSQEIKDAKNKLAEAKNKAKENRAQARTQVKAARTKVKKAKINSRLQRLETAYQNVIKKAEAKGLSTVKIKADIEVLKTAELKLKTDLESDAVKEVIQADRAAIKAAHDIVKSDAKELRTQLQAKK